MPIHHSDARSHIQAPILCPLERPMRHLGLAHLLDASHLDGTCTLPDSEQPDPCDVQVHRNA